MRNRKKRRKGEDGLAAQPLGPASPVRARRPRLPRPPVRPAPTSCRCHLGPRVSRALFTRTPLFPSPQSLPADPARQPSPAHLPHAAANRQPTGGRQRVQSGPRGHARAMALPPWRSAHANAMPTTHAPQAAQCAWHNPQSSAMELGAPAIRAPAPEP